MSKKLLLIIIALIGFGIGAVAFAYTQTYTARDKNTTQLTTDIRDTYEVGDNVDIGLRFIDTETNQKPENLGVVVRVDNGSFRQVIDPASTRVETIVNLGVLSEGRHTLTFRIPDGCGTFYDFSRFGGARFDYTYDCEFTRALQVGDANDTGCTDPTANNYDPGATIDDGSCEFGIVDGCTNPAASNYNPRATNNDGSCQFASTVGCTNPVAANYNPSATVDNGNCILYEYGCTDPRALNFDSDAEANDGSCDYDIPVSDFECSTNNQNWFECEGRTFTLRTDEDPIYVRTEPQNAGTWFDWCTGEIGNGVQAQFTELTNNGDNAQVNFTFDRAGTLFDMVLCLNPDQNIGQSFKNIKLKVVNMDFREN